jgi:hypothetical protein
VSKLFTGIVLFSLVYLPLFWRISMNTYERELICKPFLKLKGKIYNAQK